MIIRNFQMSFLGRKKDCFASPMEYFEAFGSKSRSNRSNYLKRRVTFIQMYYTYVYVHMYFSQIHTNGELTGSKRTRGYDKLYIHSIKTDFGRKSFSHMGSMAWNRFPSNLRESSSMNGFKSRISCMFN